MNVRTIVLAVAACCLWSGLTLAQITGSAKVDGAVPEMPKIDMSAVKECAALHPDPVSEQGIVATDKGELQYVIVSIKPDEGATLSGEAAKQPAIIDQQGCMYHPHVLAMMAGQTLLVKNSDAFLHNFHALGEKNPQVNFAQANKDQGKPITDIKSPEYFHVKCDVHPWMSAYVGVFDHPFFTVSAKNGKYSINTKGLADGDYTLLAWHERLGTQEQKVTVKDGKAAADFTFKPDAAQGPESPPMKEIRVASSSIKVTEKPMSCCAPAKAD